MFSFHSKYSVYRELKRAPQKLSFCFKCQDTGTVRILGIMLFCKKCYCLSSCFSLCCYYAHFFRLKELFQVKNGLTTSLRFFYENAKNLARSDDAKRKKKQHGLTTFSIFIPSNRFIKTFFAKSVATSCLNWFS